MKTLGLAVVTTALLTPAASTQARPNFTGTWEFLSSVPALHSSHGVASDDLCGDRCEIVQDGQLLKITVQAPVGRRDTRLFPLDGVEYTRVRATQGAAPGANYTAQTRWVGDNIEIRIVQQQTATQRGEDKTYTLWHRNDAMTIEIATPAAAPRSGMFVGRTTPSRLHYKKR